MSGYDLDGHRAVIDDAYGNVEAETTAAQKRVTTSVTKWYKQHTVSYTKMQCPPSQRDMCDMVPRSYDTVITPTQPRLAVIVKNVTSCEGFWGCLKSTVTEAVDSAVEWVDEHKADIAGFAVGAIVGIGCGIAIGWTGVGAVACGALAGIAGSLVTGAMEGKQGWDLVTDAVIGGVIGGITGGLGSALSAGVSNALKGLVTKTVGNETRNIFTNFGHGFANEIKNIGTGLANSARNIGNGISNATRDTAESIRNAFNPRNCLRPHSFAPATPVLMADGTTKHIGDIQPGDKVTATDPTTDTTSAQAVTALHTNNDTDLTDVTVTNPETGTTAVLHTTAHHPFWNADTQQWTNAADLKPGDHLTDAHGRTAQLVTAVRTWTGLQHMRDLTIADTHTYYVIAGTTPVLVHNCGGGTANSPRGLDNMGGVISEEGANAAGGRVFTSTGQIAQNDFAGIVNGGLMRGDDVHIITGAHGFPDGSILPDSGMHADDVARFGGLPGVTVHDLPSMTAAEVQQVMRGPGTIIGGFCDSAACLAPHK